MEALAARWNQASEARETSSKPCKAFVAELPTPGLLVTGMDHNIGNGLCRLGVCTCREIYTAANQKHNLDPRKTPVWSSPQALDYMHATQQFSVAAHYQHSVMLVNPRKPLRNKHREGTQPTAPEPALQHSPTHKYPFPPGALITTFFLPQFTTAFRIQSPSTRLSVHEYPVLVDKHSPL